MYFLYFQAGGCLCPHPKLAFPSPHSTFLVPLALRVGTEPVFEVK